MTHPTSHPASRSSTPSRLYSSRLGSSSRTHLPQPKVLPFPDLPVRPGMSREHSRGPSPLGTPPGSSLNIQAMGMASTTSLASFPFGNSNNHEQSSSTGFRLAHSASPTHPSPLGHDTARAGTSTGILSSSFSPPATATSSAPTTTRPRAATSVAAVTISRQEGFQPASRPATPTVMPVNATSGGSSSSSRVPLAGSPPTIMATTTRSPITVAASAAMPPPPVAVAAAAAAASTPIAPATPVVRPIPTKKPSNPLPSALPPSVPVTPPPPPGALVEHLHRSLKTGACADVRIWVRKWGVGWLVHKMVLVQAGFFHSLFLGGFSETAPVHRSPKGKGRAGDANGGDDDEWTGEDIELTFDDPNITRAAFEICLSRLYSPYPQLHFPVSLLPTSSMPLTPSFSSGAGFPRLQKVYDSVPPNTHLVTPRLLLSLLATATYLGHQYLLREVLAIVLRTVGPNTVTRYINFAIGNGVGAQEWPTQDDEGARGMESVARTVSSASSNSNNTYTDSSDEWVSDYDDAELPDAPTAPRLSTDSAASDDVAKVGGDTSISRSVSVKSSATVTAATADTTTSTTATGATEDDAPFHHFYGFVSNKIGEACVCWLTRWGMDVLNIEAAAAVAASTRPSAAAAVDTMPTPVWSQGGVPAHLAAAVLSSDALFVPNEMERYRTARRVLDLRRAGWDALAQPEDVCPTSSSATPPEDMDGWDEDERELAKVFAEGIYYSHMTFDDMSLISSDVDPSTTLPYAPLTVLQAAHWSAADLKTRLTHERVPASAPQGELGLTQTTSDISAMCARRRVGRSRVASPSGHHSTMSFSSLSLSLSSTSTSSGMSSGAHPFGDGVYHPVPADDTHRIGAGGLLFLNPATLAATIPSIPGLPDMGPEWLTANDESAPAVVTSSSKKTAPAPPQGERTFFGIKRGARRAHEIDARYREEGGSPHVALPGIDKGKEERWSKVEPYRFSVEFWGVNRLAERERLYSATHFYAGSFFNVYVSIIRKKEKGVQLGIYLHRQSPAEAFPPVNVPPSAAAAAAPNAATSDRSGGITAPSPTLASAPFEPVARTASLPASPGDVLYRTFSVSPPSVGSPGIRGDQPLPLDGGEGPHALSTSATLSAGYIDPRAITKAYFSISCASALGTALVRFSSAPDQFALSQSWGWKSSALRSEEYLSVPVQDGDAVLAWVGEAEEAGGGGGNTVEGGSLRATVVVGII